jgi:hypothetical protein
MNQLKFSHNYLKLPPNWEGKKATLLFVREINLEDQTEQFLDYDTTYSNGVGEWVERYDLPKSGKYLLLLFECEGTVFTTLRRSYGSKMGYYLERLNCEFELVKIEEEKK